MVKVQEQVLQELLPIKTAHNKLLISLSSTLVHMNLLHNIRFHNGHFTNILVVRVLARTIGMMKQNSHRHTKKVDFSTTEKQKEKNESAKCRVGSQSSKAHKTLQFQQVMRDLYVRMRREIVKNVTTIWILSSLHLSIFFCSILFQSNVLEHNHVQAAVVKVNSIHQMLNKKQARTLSGSW